MSEQRTTTSRAQGELHRRTTDVLGEYVKSLEMGSKLVEQWATVTDILGAAGRNDITDALNNATKDNVIFTLPSKQTIHSADGMFVAHCEFDRCHIDDGVQQQI